MKNKYEWQSYTCQPSIGLINGNENIYRVEFVRGDILTLEGRPASLPFGGSSGRWGGIRKSMDITAPHTHRSRCDLLCGI